MSDTLGNLDPRTVRRRLRRGRLRLRIGPFVVRLRSSMDGFARWLCALYRDYPVEGVEGFSDFHIRLDRPWSIRRWWRPQVQFALDGEIPFKPLPLSQACPFFEWGLNWCVAQRAQQYLIVHAAVVERGGRALLLPGSPGVGKSTLCAGLVARGWRLFSDELVLLRTGDCEIDPFPRPVSLKNASIRVIKDFAPEAWIGPECHDTAKGTVAHLRPPRASLEAAETPAVPAWLVFPNFASGAAASLEGRSPASAFRELIDNAFNYTVQSADGFRGLAGLVQSCPPLELTYGNLDDACDRLEELAAAPLRENAIGADR